MHANLRSPFRLWANQRLVKRGSIGVFVGKLTRRPLRARYSARRIGHAIAAPVKSEQKSESFASWLPSHCEFYSNTCEKRREAHPASLRFGSAARAVDAGARRTPRASDAHRVGPSLAPAPRRGTHPRRPRRWSPGRGILEPSETPSFPKSRPKGHRLTSRARRPSRANARERAMVASTAAVAPVPRERSAGSSRSRRTPPRRARSGSARKPRGRMRRPRRPPRTRRMIPRPRSPRPRARHARRRERPGRPDRPRRVRRLRRARAERAPPPGDGSRERVRRVPGRGDRRGEPAVARGAAVLRLLPLPRRARGAWPPRPRRNRRPRGRSPAPTPSAPASAPASDPSAKTPAGAKSSSASAPRPAGLQAIAPRVSDPAAAWMSRRGCRTTPGSRGCPRR